MLWFTIYAPYRLAFQQQLDWCVLRDTTKFIHCSPFLSSFYFCFFFEWVSKVISLFWLESKINILMRAYLLLIGFGAWASRLIFVFSCFE